ncbi:MAG: hypothetical protein K0Q92_3577, partial [Steroidobacteraceae bacterium]|nr:hypothetical protein [Steroidobacteraceae bacterium]
MAARTSPGFDSATLCEAFCISITW